RSCPETGSRVGSPPPSPTASGPQQTGPASGTPAGFAGCGGPGNDGDGGSPCPAANHRGRRGGRTRYGRRAGRPRTPAESYPPAAVNPERSGTIAVSLTPIARSRPARDAVLLHLLADGIAADAEDVGGLRDVPIDLLERFADRPRFHVTEGEGARLIGRR